MSPNLDFWECFMHSRLYTNVYGHHQYSPPDVIEPSVLSMFECLIKKMIYYGS